MNALEKFIKDGYPGAMSYQDFRELVNKLLAEGKVTGHEQNPELVLYTEMNNQRMNRLEKHYKVSPELKAKVEALQQEFTFLTITEGWCGDSSQIIPVIEKLAACNPRIRSVYILRDENPDIMNLLLTNGGRSIPITVCVNNATGAIVWKYGPRPAAGTEIVRKGKAAGMAIMEISEELHLWYARNKQVDIEQELLSNVSKMA
ncbi:MAG TPA: thioredoxin family protein [Flavobacteriales bacterium]